jgi:dienelactone hydrolase
MKHLTAILFSLVLLSGCYLSRSADKPDELARTWDGATVVVPFSKADPSRPDVTGEMRSVEARLMTAGVPKLPLVIFLHGCNGLHGGYRVDLDFLRSKGYAVIAPDSFSREYKPRSCDWRSKSAGFHPGVIGFRLAETDYAIERALRFPWVDPDRIILMGQSEGGLTTANYEGNHVAARVILGWTCQIPWPPLWGVKGDDSVPVLAVVSENDRWFQRWFLRGHCGEDMGGFADATSVVLEGASTHHVMRLGAARSAVGRFLARVAASPVTTAQAE